MERTPILILHGWDVSSANYSKLKKFSDEKGYQVFIPQLPGFIKSELPTEVYSLDDYVKFVVDFMGKKKIDYVFLIGHSFGGRVAIKLAALYPEKVKALVLTGVPAIRNKTGKRLFFLTLAKIGKAFLLIPPLCFLKKDGFLQKGARKILYRLAGEWDYYKTKGTMCQTFKKIVGEDLLPYLSKIRVPTLLIWGESDKMVPVSVAEKMVAKIPGAKMAVIPSASHKLPYEQPKIFSEKCLEFFSPLL